MKISKKLFLEIFEAAKKEALEDYDGSNSHAYFNIIEVIKSYQKKHPEVDDEISQLIVSRIFNPPHEAFPK